MTKPAIRVLKQPPRPMGVAPVRGGVLQARLVAEQGQPGETLEIRVPEKFEIPRIAEAREGWVEAPLEPTEAMLAAGVNALDAKLAETEYPVSIPPIYVQVVYTAMINARFDEPPVDTQALFGASSSEIKAALTLYRKMKAPKKRRATPSGSPQSS